MQTVEETIDVTVAVQTAYDQAGAVTFTPLKAGATRVWVRFEWAPETFTDKVGAALGFDNMQVRANLRRFKEFIEARGTETGAWRAEVH